MLTSLKGVGVRALLGVARRIAPRYDIDGIEFLDLRPSGGVDRQEILKLLHDAMYEIDWAGYRTPVVTNLRVIVGTDRGERAVSFARCYLCPFGSDLRGVRAMACTLIWLATYFEQASSIGKRRSSDDVLAACLEAELTFVSKFPNAEGWIQFLKEHHRPIAVGW